MYLKFHLNSFHIFYDTRYLVDIYYSDIRYFVSHCRYLLQLHKNFDPILWRCCHGSSRLLCDQPIRCCSNLCRGFYWWCPFRRWKVLGLARLLAPIYQITKISFTYEYTGQNFRLQLLRLVNRLYPVIHKTQKS